MCFGRKDNIQDEDGPRPAQFAPPQPTYASNPQKASIPVSPVSPSPVSPFYQQHTPPQQQQQHQPPPPAMAELAAPEHDRPELGGDDIAPPSGPPPSHRQAPADDFAPPAGPPPARNTHGDFAPPPGPPPARNTHDDVAPPPGPPPSHRPAAAGDDFAPPAGPPPSQSNNPFRQQRQAAPSTSTSDYAPPSGPPPAFTQGDYKGDYTAPPSGPPPSTSKPGHDWESLVPDTSLFPPPPDIFSGYDRSPASNATEQEAETGEAWVISHPLSPPLDLPDSVLDGRRTGSIRLMAPEAGPFRGKLEWLGNGTWSGKTTKKAGDYCYIGYPPLYAVKRDSPLAMAASGKGKKRTIYYEVRVLPSNPSKDISLAIGFTALPYPSFRMPGWHRGSLAVHGDDGHKYINDRWGGKDFVPPMKRGETYGLGMTFTAAEGGRVETDIFYTHGGREVGRWNLHEETDAEQDLPVTGLEGYHDLAAAVGTFGEVAFEAVFEPGRWLYKQAAGEVYV